MRLEFLWKNKFTKIFSERKDKLYAEFAQKEKELRDELNRAHSVNEEKLSKLVKDKSDLEDQERRVLDRRVELEKVSKELKDQIRLLEAKAAPDHVWVEAFSQGFSKAWDMMMPMMVDGIGKVKDEIRNQEIDNSIPRLNVMVNQRIDELGKYELKSIEDLYAKRNDFLAKKVKATTEDDKRKYDNYLEVINWLLSRRNGN